MKTQPTTLMLLHNRNGETYVESYFDRQSMMLAGLKIADTIGMKNMGAADHEPMLAHSKFLRDLAKKATKIAKEVETHVAAKREAVAA